jgi:hypothetical protein
LRNFSATAFALPVRGIAYAAAGLRRASIVKPAMVVGAVALVVSGLLVGLPAKSVAGQTVPTFAPLAPQADAHRSGSGLALDVPFEIQFTKPMNQSTVAAAVTITPTIRFRSEWDVTGQILSIAPLPYWQPYTQYTVDISTDATDEEGLNLVTPVHESFQSGSPTAGEITATKMFGDRASPSTTFQITFTRPVKLAAVELRFGINPTVDVAIVGDDPTDATSQVFTVTPKKPLATNTAYLISLADGGTDAAGATLRSVDTLAVTTLPAPSVTFTPQDGTITYDTNQPISVKFSVPMDPKAATAALSVTVNGRAIAGSTSWTDDAMTLTFTPSRSFNIGYRVSVQVAASARSTGGLTMAAAASIAFTVSTPRTRTYASGGTSIPWTGGIASTTAPYHAAELYYLSLMNCTRTGGWVTSSGVCSTETHHTMPAQSALAYNDSIANAVSRPYAKALADRGVLTHYLDGSTVHSRLSAQGFTSPSWGENIASPSNAGQGGMVSIEIFFQDESWNRGGHYYNIMNSHFRWAAVGVWVSNSVRVVIDFYG